MKIWYVSDLHYENSADGPLLEKPDDAEVLVVAGDLHHMEGVIDWLPRQRDYAELPVVYTPGNHEFYRRGKSDPGEKMLSLEEVNNRLREAFANEPDIHFLQNDSIILGNDQVRFVGATLWTDFALHGSEFRGKDMSAAGDIMNDYHSIYFGNRRWLRPEDTARLHEESRGFFEDILNTSHNGATVIISHHAPHPQSCEPAHPDRFLDPAYASDLSDLMIAEQGPDLWIHGHFHFANDYEVGNCRVLSNPSGRGRHYTASFPFENADWDPKALINTEMLPRFRPGIPTR